MRKNDVGLLRSLIRELVNEAPYRSSQRITLSGVPQVGTPDIRGTLTAGGMVGLIQLYDWAAGLCNVADQNNMFPIKLSKPAADKVATAASTAFDANYPAYKATIAAAGSSSTQETSDLANLEVFYGQLEKAYKAWPINISAASGIDPRAKEALLTDLKALLGIYTGCGDAVVLNEIPIASRDEYEKFLKDIGNLSTETFKTGLAEQRAKMIVPHATSQATITRDVNASTKRADALWNAVKGRCPKLK